MVCDGFELVSLPGGARSLRSTEHGETFHPGIGPMEEARLLHVAQHRLAERLRAGEGFTIWDVGLGAGANALAVIEAMATSTAAQVQLVSFDRTLEPLRFALQHARELEYPAPWRNQIATLLAMGRVKIGSVDWRFDSGDFRERAGSCDGPAPNAILFDPYSPSANPEIWTREVFQTIRRRAAGDCTLTTYSRSTVTRARLLLAGWFVGRGAATGEKTETTMAATSIELLKEPLRRDWLARVARSAAAAQVDPTLSVEALSAALSRCPQMSNTFCA